MFDRLGDHLSAEGYQAKQGQIVDVSIVPVPIQRNSRGITGVWSLWEVSLSADTFSRKSFLPAARRIWDLLLSERMELLEALSPVDSLHWDQSLAAATVQGEQNIQELIELHRTRLQEARERARYAFEAGDQAIGRIGLPAVRAYRRRRLEQELMVPFVEVNQPN